MMKKIKKWIDALKMLSKNFGVIFALKCLVLRIVSFLKYERFIYNYLSRYFRPVIEKYRAMGQTKKTEKEQSSEAKIVWSLWWQGEKNAPEIVKVCLDSQRRIFEKIGADFIVLDKGNWRQYIDLPEHILAKVENRKITLTHFSDVIRATLLSKYGGLWIDATVYCTKQIEDNRIFQQFYTAKTHEKGDALTLRRWTGFLIGSPADSILFNFMQDCFDFYWKERNALVAYLLIDYIIAIAYEYFPEVKKAIDSVEVSNQGMWTMLRKMNTVYNKSEWLELCKSTTFVKLSYKDEFNGGALKEYADTGELTNWGYLLKKSTDGVLATDVEKD